MHLFLNFGKIFLGNFSVSEINVIVEAVLNCRTEC